MHDLISLTKRHMLNFLRDKTAVFFSFLSVLILLALYFLFIGESYASAITLQGDQNLDENLKTYVIAGVMMGGILVINTISLSLGIMGNVVTDLDQRKLDAFLVTPVKRYKLIFSYYISSIIVSSVLTIFMWVLTVLYVGVFSGYWYSIYTIFIVTLYLILFTLISASLMIFLVTLLKSVNAFGALSGILGTFIGFASGIYMPLVQLGKTTQYIASVLPFTHMAIILKKLLLKEPYELLIDKGLDASSITSLERVFGSYEIGVFGFNVSMIYILFVSLMMAALLLFFAYRNMTKKMIK